MVIYLTSSRIVREVESTSEASRCNFCWRLHFRAMRNTERRKQAHFPFEIRADRNAGLVRFDVCSSAKRGDMLVMMMAGTCSSYAAGGNTK